MLQFNNRIRLGRNILLVVATVGLLLLYLMSFLYTKARPCDADRPGCRQVYMSPSYARLKALDESHTQLASKYSLYLYREQGRDTFPTDDNHEDYLSGIPILFIPGNAGSYKQARLIAAETANQFYGDEHSNLWAKNLDFFTADFNEDFTAFHGRTVVDQAEYLNDAIKFILGLYENKPIPPQSVILLGHSMGGVVARAMLSLPNYLPKSVNTIITLATPHAAAPLTFDGDLLKIYSAVDRFWYEGYKQGNNNSDVSEFTQLARDTLADVSLISITGGLLDNTLPADYTTLGYLVPPDHGFTVYTTGIPNVWTPIDHLAIVWCDQLRKVVLRSLLAIADKNSVFQILSLSKRMKMFRKYFLSGFEDYCTQDSLAFQLETKVIDLKLDSKKMRSVKIGDKVLRFKPGSPQVNEIDDKSIMNVLYLPVDEGVKTKFSLLSSLPIVNWQTYQEESENISPSILLCSNLNRNIIEKQELEGNIYDFTTQATSEYVALRCIDIKDEANIVPRSSKSSKSLSESSIGGEHEPFNAIQLNLTVLKDYDVIIVAESTTKSDSNTDQFVVAELSELPSTEYDLGKDMLTLMRRGADLSLPSKRPLSTNINIPGAWSSLLAYKIKLVYSNTGKADTDKTKKKKLQDGSNAPKGAFAPFIRQWTSEPYETKWHINVEEHNSILLSMHGIAPFTPFRIKPDANYGVNIEIWSDSTRDESTLDIILSIDYINSLRLLILRYRLALVCYCVLIVLLAFLFQFNYFIHSNVFPNIVYGLSKICSAKNLGIILFTLSVASPIVNISFVQKILNLIDPVVLQDPNEINLSLQDDFKLNSFFLGLEEPYLWLVGPIFFLIGVSIVLATYYALMVIGIIVSTIVKFLQFRKNVIVRSRSKEEDDDVENEKGEGKATSSTSSSNVSTPLPISRSGLISPAKHLIAPNLGVEASKSTSASASASTSSWLTSLNGRFTGKNNSTLSIRRLVANIVILGTIPFFLPYQFAYMICATVQIITTIKLLCSNNINKNAFNYHLTILILMLWVLPINVPVLIVFIHNFTVNWKTPFSSHHNVLAILPMLLLMERHASGYYLPKLPAGGHHHSHSRNMNTVTNKISKYVTRSIVGYFIFYCIIYGIRHTFWLHHLLNIFFCWLLIFYFIN